MRIALISDAWAPQVNGVVRTLTATTDQLRRRGHGVETITPSDFRTVPCPTYPEIRLAVGCGGGVQARLDGYAPEAIHIATEGPLGWAARRWCIGAGMPFTTSFHTRFPDYAALRTGLPARVFWPIVRRFHRPATRVFAATRTLEQELAAKGLHHTHRWSRGVDLALFTPEGPGHAALENLARPIQLYVGRIAVEKNIDAFLRARVPGTKVVVGDGPARARLQAEHPDVRFLGALHGAALASAYASADVSVFPSLTDTFGLVMIEALACGVPIAAYPVAGPLDIVGRNGSGRHGRAERIGMLDSDLEKAIVGAMASSRGACAREARHYSWQESTGQFLDGLAPITIPERMTA